MNREELKSLGLTDEQVESVIKSHAKVVQSNQNQLNTLTTERDELKTQLNDRDKDLAKLKKDFGDNADAKEKFEALQQSYKELETSTADKIVKIQLDSALSQQLAKSKAKNEKAVLALLDHDKIKFENGELTGFNEQLEALKQSDSFLFDLGTPKPGYTPAGGGTPAKYSSFEEAMKANDIDTFFKQQIEEE